MTALAVSLLSRTVMPPVATSGFASEPLLRTRSVVPSRFTSPVEMELMFVPARTCCSGFELLEPKLRLPRLWRMADEVAVGEDEVELAVVGHVNGGYLVEVARWREDHGGGVGSIGFSVPDVDRVRGGGVGVGMVGGGVVDRRR